MKPLLVTFTTFALLIILSACMSQPPSAVPVLIQSDTAIPSTTTVPLTEIVPTPTTNDTAAPSEVTKDDNGKTFNLKVGDSFLLHLGTDFYDWSVEVDNQNVLSRKINITVINGAQGVYKANAPGTATLTASGNPKCLSSTPPCMSPSITLTITVVVQ